MAQNIRIKRRSSPGSTGAPSALKTSELAFNENDKTLYIGIGDDGGGDAQNVLAIGGDAFVPVNGSYVKTVEAADDSGVSASTSGNDVTISGVDASTTAKGVVTIATAQDIIDGTNGAVIDAAYYKDNKYELPIASASELGGIKIGDGLKIDGDGVASVTLDQGTVLKGKADFTDASAMPDAPENGWIYINDTDGTGAWTGIVGTPVVVGVEAIWSAADSEWAVITSAGGVKAITGVEPIEIDTSTNGASEPIVKVKDATEAKTGVVRLATDAEITNGQAGVAVQASQMKDAFDNFKGLPDGTETGDLLIWDGSKWDTSTTLDGGTF